MRFTKREVALAVALLSSGVFAAPTSKFEARAGVNPLTLAKAVGGGIKDMGSSSGGNNAGSSSPTINTSGQPVFSNTNAPAGFSEQEAALKPSKQKRDDGASHEFISISRKRDVGDSRASGRGFEKRRINPFKAAETIDSDVSKANKAKNGVKKTEEVTHAVNGGGNQNQNGAASTTPGGTTKPADTSTADKAKPNKETAKEESVRKSKTLTPEEIKELKSLPLVEKANLGPNQLRQLMLDPSVKPDLKAQIRKDPILGKKLNKAEEKHGAAISPGLALTKEQIAKLDTLEKIKAQEALLSPAQLLQLTQSKDRAGLKKQVENDPVLKLKLEASGGHHAKQQNPAEIKKEAQEDGISVQAEEAKQEKAGGEPPTTSPNSEEPATSKTGKPGLLEQGLKVANEANTALDQGKTLVDTSTGLKNSVQAFTGKGASAAKDTTDASAGGNDKGTNDDSGAGEEASEAPSTKETADTAADVPDDVTSTKAKTATQEEAKRAVTFTS